MDLLKKVFSKMSDGVENLKRSDNVKQWLQELDEAQKREKGWRKRAAEVVELYEQEGSGDANNLSDFNILYANTETLAPAVYNAVPRPVVKRRTERDNPVAIASAQVLKAVLIYLTNNADMDDATFDDLQKSAVQEALVPGRGLARFYFDADMDEDSQMVKSEEVCGLQVPWNRVVYGYAKNWHQIPWIGYEHFMTRDECLDNFGPQKGAAIKLTHSSSANDDAEKKDKVPADSEGVKFAHIWEIWDKRTKKVIFISDGYPNILKQEDDPLGLDGFFDCPRPIMFLQRISSLVPQTLYQMYEKQARELDTATRRINGLLHAMKIRGFYDGTIEGLDELLKAPENTLLPARNVAAMQQGQTLEKAIWLMPLETLIVVLQQLYAARTQIINTIHQLTGIADIMRGASQASETLGAQEIKQAWGTMRLKRMQKEVARFARDCYRIEAEIAAKHYSQETLAKISGVQLPKQADKQQAQLQLQQLQQQVMAMQQQQPQPGMQPGAQPGPQPGGPPPQLPPEVQQQMAQLQQTLQTPAWEDVIAFLRNDQMRNYVIDIETNSTIDIEATEDKQELAEMMNSMSQLMNGVFPMVEKGVLPFQAAKSLMLSVISKFRLGDEVEETFRAMQPPPPPGPDPKDQAAIQKVQEEMRRDTMRFDIERQRMELEHQDRQSELDAERQMTALKLSSAQAQEASDQRMIALKEKVEEARLQRELTLLAAKAAVPIQPLGTS